VRGSRGPRQPGGGKQIAGPRHHFARHHPEALGAKRRSSKGAGSGISGPSSFEARRWRAPQDEEKQKNAPLSAPTGVQSVTVASDESGMRVDRFLEARHPGLSFSHIQRVIRKGEVRVDGKRTQPKNRLAAGQMGRIPP
jgi:23S rRNA pseudouridine955/2504/2580 synthase